jgi:hypothetical protein
MTDLQRRVARRLALLGPGPESFFKDACRLVDEVQAGRWSLTTAKHLVSHLLRDLDSSVRYVLYTQLVELQVVVALEPPVALEPGRELPVDAVETPAPVGLEGCDDDGPGGSQRQQVDAILRALDFPANSLEYAQWYSLGRGPGALHRLAHRDALNPPRALDAHFVASFDSITRLFDVVLERFEVRYAKVYDQLDALLAKESPRREDVQFLRQRVPNTPRTLSYFFERLQYPNWLEPLASAGYFRAPPPPDINSTRNTIGFPHWMAMSFLARIAPIRPARVAEIVASIPETENVRVSAQLIEVILALPSEERVALAPRVQRWVPGLATYHWGDHVPRLALALLHDGAVDAAFALTESILGLPEGWSTTPSPYTPSYYGGERGRTGLLREAGGTLLPALCRQAPVRTLSLVAGALDYYVGRLPDDASRAGDAPEGLGDYSCLWADDLGEREGIDASDLRVFLVHVVREGVRRVGVETPAMLSDVIAILRQRGARVLRRIELAVLAELLASQEEAVMASALPLALERLTSRGILVESDLDAEVGDLLKSAFPLATDVERRRVLDALMPPDFGWMESPDNVTRRQAQWRRDRLALISGVLPSRERGELTALIRSEGEPDPLHQSRGMVESSSGRPSPLDGAAIRSMDLEELLGFLTSWAPRVGFHEPSREGLAHHIESLATEDPAEHSTWAPRFIGQHPVYVGALLDGFRAAARTERRFPWANVFALIEWAVNEQVPSDDMSDRGDLDQSYDWRQVRRSAADLMGMALGRQKGADAPPYEERDRLWRIIASIAEDVNPSPAYETRWGGPNMDPSTLAINSVRPEAIDAAIRFAYWSAQHHAESAGAVKDVLAGEPCVASLLDRHLDPARDPSMAVRAAIGRWLTPLARTDGAWVASHMETLLPSKPEHQALRDALWEAFTQWSQPHPDALPILEGEYRRSIDQLTAADRVEAPTKRDGERPRDRLAEHIVALYWWGAITLDEPDNLVYYLFRHADVRRREHALQHLGFSLFHLQGPIDALSLARLQQLWDWRATELFQALEAGRGVVDGGEVTNDEVLAPDQACRELKQFGLWFASKAFAREWALEWLSRVLSACGNVNLDHAVVEHLVELAPLEPMRVASCVLAVDFTGGGEPWSVHSWLEHLATILRPALTSDDPAISRVGREAVNRVVAAGYVEHRTLLQGPRAEQLPASASTES